MRGIMRIAIVTQPWAGIGEGGAIGLLTCRLAQTFGKTEEVYIYGKNGRCESTDGNIRSVHLPIRYERIFDRILKRLNRKFHLWKNDKPYFIQPYYYFWYALRLAIDLRGKKCDVVHIHMLSQFIPVIKFVNPQIKVVLHNHLEWLGYLDREVLGKRLKKTDLILECSNHNRNVAVGRYPEIAEKCRICFNGVDLNRFQPPEDGSQQKSSDIVFVGRISPEKGVHVLIEAFNRVADIDPSSNLILIGPENPLAFEQLVNLSQEPRIQELSRFYNDIPYTEAVRNLIRPELKQRVRFAGFIPNSELPNYYGRAGIFINSSLIEAFPLPLVEAMGSGLPVIAPRVGGIPEIVEDGTSGLLFEAGNADELSEKIATLLTNPEYRMKIAETGRLRATEMFSWDKIALELLETYRRIVGGQGKRNRRYIFRKRGYKPNKQYAPY